MSRLRGVERHLVYPLTQPPSRLRDSLRSSHPPRLPQLPKDWHYILKNSGSKVVITSREDIFNTVKPWISEMDNLEHAMCFDDDFDHSSDDSWVKAIGADSAAAAPAAIPPTAADMGVLMYTSGTTGNPKGVMLSHENIASNTRGLLEGPAESLSQENDVSLAFLPWAHIYGQTLEMHCGHAAGFASAIVEDTTQVAIELPLVRPTLLFSVPTLYKKIYDGLNAKIPTESPIKQKLIRAALASGEGEKVGQKLERGSERTLRRTLQLFKARFAPPSPHSSHNSNPPTHLHHHAPTTTHPPTQSRPRPTLGRRPSLALPGSSTRSSTRLSFRKSATASVAASAPPSPAGLH